MAHRFRDPAPSTPNNPAELGGHDHYHRFLRRLFGPQVRSASRSQGHLDRTTASAGLCCRANSLRSNQPNLCGMMCPHRALTSGGVTQIVAAAARRAGLGQIYAHRLRHTAATQMLRAGASLPEIGQLLRHRRAMTTAIYAKVNRDALRTIARPWPEDRA